MQLDVNHETFSISQSIPWVLGLKIMWLLEEFQNRYFVIIFYWIIVEFFSISARSFIIKTVETEFVVQTSNWNQKHKPVLKNFYFFTSSESLNNWSNDRFSKNCQSFQTFGFIFTKSTANLVLFSLIYTKD